jgi:hypothetical protein
VVSTGTQLRLLEPVQTVGAGVVTSTGGSVVSGTQLRLLDPVQTVGAGVVTSVGAGVVTSTGGEQLRLLVPIANSWCWGGDFNWGFSGRNAVASLGTRADFNGS